MNQYLKSILKKIIPRKLLTARYQLKFRIMDETGRIGSRIIGHFPLRTRSILKQNLIWTGDLDYSKKPIKLQVDNWWDFYRLQSCTKEPETVRWIEEQIRSGDVFYDIGANVGAYSLVACAACDGLVKVFAFEPSFSTFTQLCKNIHLNHYDDEIFPLSIALSDRTQVCLFNYTDLAAGSSQHWVSGGNEIIHERTRVYKQPILAFRLDDLIEQFGIEVPNLIKMDVDGFESSILRGAENTLKHAVLRSILVEVDTGENHASNSVIDYLEANGFCLQEKHKRGDDKTFNLIFYRNST